MLPVQRGEENMAFCRLITLADVSSFVLSKTNNETKQAYYTNAFTPIQDQAKNDAQNVKVVVRASAPTTPRLIASKPFIQYTHPPLVKAKRKRAAPWQLDLLKKAFAVNPFPSASERITIATSSAMTERAVQIWFQNSRQAIKNRGLTLKRPKDDELSSTCDSSE